LKCGYSIKKDTLIFRQAQYNANSYKKSSDDVATTAAFLTNQLKQRKVDFKWMIQLTISSNPRLECNDKNFLYFKIIRCEYFISAQRGNRI